MFPLPAKNRIPLWLKVAYTLFMAILLPIYLKRYGPTNFLYFCDVAAIVTLIAIWLESPPLLSACLVGILLPQLLWVLDFFFEFGNYLGLWNAHLMGMTNYMFRPPWLLRFLSFFHFWLPFLLLYLVWRVGYDKRGVVIWIVSAWVLLTICYVYMPPPSPCVDPVTRQQLRSPDMPANINYVYGLTGEERAQTAMHPDEYFVLYLVLLPLVIYLPTHLLCWWLMPKVRTKETVALNPEPRHS
ncbi:MAG: hypothetical protein QM703_03745 [Gemmatales bacterium]